MTDSASKAAVPLHQDRPPHTIVAAAVIVRDGRILLTQRRANDHLGGLWEFPGGKLERGESPTDAVVRECLEETGLTILVREILEVTFHAYESRDVLLLFYRCDWVAGEVEHKQVADHAWVAPDALAEYKLPPADVNVVAKIRAMFG